MIALQTLPVHQLLVFVCLVLWIQGQGRSEDSPLPEYNNGYGLPTFQTVGESWCSKRYEERQVNHTSPKTSCNDSISTEANSVGFSKSITITEQDLINCTDSQTGSHQVFQALAVNLTFRPKVHNESTSDQAENVILCEFELRAPKSMFFLVKQEDIGIPADLLSQILFFDLYSTYEDLLDIEPGNIYYSRHNVVLVWVIGIVESSFQIQAVPDCVRELQVFCYSDKGGYIQTPRWDGVTHYPKLMYSCVTLLIPTDNVVMVSLVSLDLETTDDCEYDALTIHSGQDCPGDGEKICEMKDLTPTIYDAAGAISFRFISDLSEENTGFRLLYSFHPNSSKPELLPDGKWNCSVPHFAEFQQHFACSHTVFCSEGQDKMECNAGNLCGQGAIKLGDSCYRLLTPYSPYTWNEAAQYCESSGAEMMDLDSAEEWRFLVNESRYLGSKDLFVGLKLTSSTAPEMYQFTWMWYDRTLAVYFDTTFKDPRTAQHCSLLRNGDNWLSDVSCDEKVSAAFFCEMRSGESTVGGSNATILLPTQTDNTTFQEHFSKCDNNHTTHDFLACDVDANCSAVDFSSSVTCSNSKFSPPVPFFHCKGTQHRIPYTLVCDHRADCCDSSDEDFCQFSPCLGRKQFACKDKKQCVLREQRCDKLSQCVDKSDELKCSDTVNVENVYHNTLLPPAVVDLTGKGSFTVTPLNSSACPETHFQCHGNGYCMPVYVRCNGVFDCRGKEDEMGCDSYTCPGFYRCRASKICLHRDHMCDGVFQCPQRDDELLCNFTCPENCTCYGHAFICTGEFSANHYPDLRYLEAPDTKLKLADVSSNRLLIHLVLRNCGITRVGELNLPNLQSLDLSYNQLTSITGSELGQLINLHYLDLAFNPFDTIHSLLGSRYTFPQLYSVNFAGLPFTEVNETFFAAFPSLKTLNLSNCGLDGVSESGFQPLKHLIELDLRGCSMQRFSRGVFEGLQQLQHVYADNYKLCCPAVLPAQLDPSDCHAPMDEVSSCDALLRSEVFRVCLALYALLALLGNLGSFIYRVIIEKASIKLGFDVFVTHLCVADFLMGAYLAIVGVADRIYDGNYRWNDTEWKHSAACKAAGFLSLLSSEVSAFLICLITLERFLVIGFPHKALRFSRWSAHVSCVTLWILGLLLAAVPLLPNTAHWQFYSQSGICIPLPVTRKEFPGGDYAFGIMIALNFVLFLFIAVGQLLIYWSIRSNSVPANRLNKKSKDMAVARRLLAVVMTDFLCWFPIGLLGILARSGVPIPGDVNVAMAIFVLPFNSALNPFLYTFNMLRERRRKAREDRLAKEERSEHVTTHNSVQSAGAVTSSQQKAYTEKEAWKLFDKFLKEGVLSLDRVRHRILDVELNQSQ